MSQPVVIGSGAGCSQANLHRHAARPDPLYHVILLAMCCGVLAMALLLSVRGGTQVMVPLLGIPLPELCMTRRIWGLECPGCGMTRCFISLAHGELAAAWSYNPAGLLLFGIMAFQLPFRGYQLWRLRRGLPELALTRAAQVGFAALGIALVVQWAMRLAGFTF